MLAAPPLLEPHDPILIDGDADLCDDEDGDGVVGLDDGIVNCDVADGTAARPYVVAGWRITVPASSTCELLGPYQDPVPPCDAPARCAGDAGDVGGAVAVCRVTRHVQLVGLELRVESGAPDVAGVQAWAAESVSLQDVEIETASLGLHAAGGAPGDGTAPVRDVSATRLRVRPVIAAGDGAVTPASLRAAVVATDVDLRLDASDINATGRLYGVLAEASEASAPPGGHRFVLEDSTVAHAVQRGVEVTGARAEILRSAFVGNGQPALSSYVGAQSPSGYSSTTVDVVGALFLSTSPLGFSIESSRFDVRGIGVAVLDNATGDILLNEFRGEMPWDIAVIDEAACRVRAAYNDFNTLRVVNDVPACFLEARRNWWGNVDGPTAVPPQVGGKVDYAAWLRTPLASLPMVAINSPGTGAHVHGTVVVTGTAAAGADRPVLRVEVSEAEDEWQEAVVAAGVAAWEATWDASDVPPGPFTLWARGCDAVDCGRPARLNLVGVEPPLPPIALLEAGRRAAHVDEAVPLDAGRSYSPQGRAVAAYRFDLGDGRTTPWIETHVWEARYASPGVYPVSVTVRDSAGIDSVNSPRLSLRILDEEGAPAAAPWARPLPAAPHALTLLALGVVSAALARRRRP